MSFQKFKGDSYRVGRRHRSSTVKTYGNVTSKGSKVLIGCCSTCSERKSTTVSDYTIQTENLGDFFKNIGKKGFNVSQKMARNVIKNPGGAVDITAKIATAAASRNPKNEMSTLSELKTFYYTG